MTTRSWERGATIQDPPAVNALFSNTSGHGYGCSPCFARPGSRAGCSSVKRKTAEQKYHAQTGVYTR